MKILKALILGISGYINLQGEILGFRPPKAREDLLNSAKSGFHVWSKQRSLDSGRNLKKQKMCRIRKKLSDVGQNLKISP